MPKKPSVASKAHVDGRLECNVVRLEAPMIASPRCANNLRSCMYEAADRDGKSWNWSQATDLDAVMDLVKNVGSLLVCVEKCLSTTSDVAIPTKFPR